MRCNIFLPRKIFISSSKQYSIKSNSVSNSLSKSPCLLKNRKSHNDKNQARWECSSIVKQHCFPLLMYQTGNESFIRKGRESNIWSFSDRWKNVEIKRRWENRIETSHSEYFYRKTLFVLQFIFLANIVISSLDDV